MIMSFSVIARKRDDCDYDAVIAIQSSGLQDELNYSPNSLLNGLLEHFNRSAPNETFVLLELENVTDVIESDLVGLSEQFATQNHC
jgi:hypothetical protein